jgi:tetratricopeptide (TPR) repeat protein
MRVALLLFGWLAWPCLALAAPFAQARGLGEQEIARLAAQLGSEVPAQRAASQRALSELHEESLPGIALRLAALRKSRPASEEVKAVLTAFRHAAGSRRGDDATDLAQGVLGALAQKRDATTLATAEPLLELRALEHMATTEAGLHMASLLALDPPGVWDFELQLARARVGLKLLPTLLELRSAGEPDVRSWAQAGVRALGMEDPAIATALEDSHLVAEVCRAYTEPLDFTAMPVIVRLVSTDKLEVREAARAAVARFGKNAIWQLRQLYEEVAGRSADRRWDAERLSRELYAALDRAGSEQAETLLAQGMARFVAGDFDAMAARYDRLLASYPSFAERAKMAPGYAAFGEKLLAQGKLPEARAAYARALRLAPTASDADTLRAQLAYADAEIALSHGVVDLSAYEQALAHDPHHAAAKQAYDRLSGAKQARERASSRLASIAAIALLAVLLIMLLRGRNTQTGREVPARDGAA